MRYLVGFVFVLALVASPLSVSAQAGEEGTEPTVEEPIPEQPAPPSEPAPEEPALQLKLDDAGVGVVPSPPRTEDGYTLEEMNVRVRRAGIGLGVSSAVLVTGGVLLGLGAAQANIATGEKLGLAGAGIGLTFVGLVTTITTGVMLRHRKRDRASLRAAHYEGPRRVQWDLARSRLVF
jgi:hypothetical protein